MVSTRLSRFPDRDEIGNLKFTRDEDRFFRLKAFLFFWLVFAKL